MDEPDTTKRTTCGSFCEIRYPDGSHCGWAVDSGFARDRVNQLGKGARLVDRDTGHVIYEA